MQAEVLLSTADSKPTLYRKRVFAMDRRMAAIHEGGHLVIARMLKLPVLDAWIAPTTNNYPWGINRTWTGQVVLGPFIKKKYTKSKKRLIGVAGVVAEQRWCGADPSDDVDWHDPHITSESDWEDIGCDPGEPNDACFNAINQVAVLLARDAGPLWPSLIEVARCLIIRSRD
jgi:hypothetical protein